MLLDPLCFCDDRGKLRVYVIVDYCHGHDLSDAMEVYATLRDCVAGTIDAVVTGSDDVVPISDDDTYTPTAVTLDSSSDKPCGTARRGQPTKWAARRRRLARLALKSRASK